MKWAVSSRQWFRFHFLCEPSRPPWTRRLTPPLLRGGLLWSQPGFFQNFDDKQIGQIWRIVRDIWYYMRWNYTLKQMLQQDVNPYLRSLSSSPWVARVDQWVCVVWVSFSVIVWLSVFLCLAVSLRWCFSRWLSLCVSVIVWVWLCVFVNLWL